jgi:hypothetical protein
MLSRTHWFALEFRGVKGRGASDQGCGEKDDVEELHGFREKQ